MDKRSLIAGTNRHDDHHSGHHGRDWINVVMGTKGDDPFLFGTDGADLIVGKKGNDLLFGGLGNDLLLGGKGNDLLDGGGGSDVVLAGKGDDLANYTLSANVGAQDFYDGGKGFDTLHLTLTSAEFALAQDDIAAFQAFLKDGGKVFHFESFGVTVRNFEALDYVVIGGNAAPVAANDSFATNQDVPVVIDVLANDSDVNGDKLSAVVIDGPTNGTLALNPDGSLSYTPNANFFGDDSFTYRANDGTDTSGLATVSLTINPVNDAPVAQDDVIQGPIHVAVVGGTLSTYIDAAAQLSDSTAFSIAATAIPVSLTTTKAEWSATLAKYDVVVVGENGLASDYNGSQIFSALRDFVDAGGGVVTTGVFASRIGGYGDTTTNADADYISPAASWPDSLFVGSGTNCSISDPANPIAGGITNYAAQGLHEVAGATDTTATVLAADSLNRAAIAYDEVGPGRTVFVGSTHMAVNQFPFDPDATRTGVVDQIFERAVAWAAGDRSGLSWLTDEDTPRTIEHALLLANDTDVDTAHADLMIASLSPTSALGAAISFDTNGNIVYDPTSSLALQQLQAGQIVTDSFDYTVVDGSGGSDIGSVSLAVAGVTDTLL